MKTLFSDYKAGAALGTDLVVTGPPVSASELLADEPALSDFLTRHRLAPDALAGGAAPSARDLASVRALREEVGELLRAESEERVAEGASALVARAGRGPVLDRDAAGEWQWYVATEPGAPLAGELGVLIGTGLLGALRTLGHARFRACASPECAGLFVDTSKAGRRRYCVPEVCGNRLNVANYRARQAGSAGTRAARP
ncbi:CGNR zinc finger domain-containing protein [Streptomyces albiaxialis]|uniref:CGNR zinc finger domain-containing protein n=1 Tax=Streptomyces albiaxialis TaxID=329523 RepID=A0ABP5GXE8_9ACTN